MTELERAYQETLKQAEQYGRSQFVCTKTMGEGAFDVSCKGCPLRKLPSCKGDFKLDAEGWRRWWNEVTGGDSL